jgi:hypothetical protein
VCTVRCSGSSPTGTTTTPATSFDVRVGSATTLAGFAALDGADAVVGSIAVTTEDLAASNNELLSLPLQVLTGDFSLGDTVDSGNVSRLLFANLREVGGDLSLAGLDDLASLQDTDGRGANDATDFSFPTLQRIDGALSITANPSLTTIAMPALASIGASLEISGNTSLTTIAMPALASIGTSLEISGNSSLTTIAMPALASIGTSLEISGNTTLTTIQLAATYRLGGVTPGRDFVIEFNGNDLTCGEIDVVLHAVDVCPAANEIAASDLNADCQLSCP